MFYTLFMYFVKLCVSLDCEHWMLLWSILSRVSAARTNHTGFHPFCPMNQVQSLNKKRASCERHNKLNRIVYTVHLHRLRSPGVGRNSAEGHLPYALRVRPQTKAHQMQAGQPARQPDPPQSGGGEQRLRGGWCVCRRVFVWFLLNEETVAVATSE